MTESEANDSVIIIFIGETDMDFVHYVVGNIEQRFPQQVEFNTCNRDCK